MLTWSKPFTHLFLNLPLQHPLGYFFYRISMCHNSRFLEQVNVLQEHLWYSNWQQTVFFLYLFIQSVTICCAQFEELAAIFMTITRNVLSKSQSIYKFIYKICDQHIATSQSIYLTFVVCDADLYGSHDGVTQMLPHRNWKVNKKFIAMWQIVGYVFYQCNL